MNKNPQLRSEALQPNEDRLIADGTQKPQEVRKVARDLLGEVSFAAALIEPSTAVTLCRNKSDADLWRFDESVGRAMFAQSAAARITVKRSLLAPLFRFVARRRVRELQVSVGPESRDATASRRVLAKQFPGLLDWDTDETWEESPLEIALSPRRDKSVMLTPDQYRACGVIELVRASGKVLGSCDGDALAIDFMNLIMDTSEGQLSAIHELDGGFLEHATRQDRCSPAPLSGPLQLLAVTILASWLRMSRLGVRMSSLDRFEIWGDFFDGQHYGAIEELVGEVWKTKPEEREEALSRMDITGPLKDTTPWFETLGGSPLVFVGLATELVRLATNRCGILDEVSEGFSIPEAGEGHLEPLPEHSDEPVNPSADRILVQLRDRHSYLVSHPLGCVRRIRLEKTLAPKAF